LSILTDIQKSNFGGKKLLAILVDPDDVLDVDHLVKELKNSPPNLILVGGSVITKNNFELVVTTLSNAEIAPVVLFPGDASQIAKDADGVLLLSLISGRNPEYLIGQHVKAARHIKDWGKEVIPTSYILLNGGNVTTVQKVSETHPISQMDIDLIIDTALAGQQMGHQLLYLETGSGALETVSLEVISSVKQMLSLPLIVGGGIKSVEKARAIWESGATLIVIGTAFEKGGINLEDLLLQRDQLNGN